MTRRPPRHRLATPRGTAMDSSLNPPAAGALTPPAPDPLAADQESLTALVPLVYRELRAIARRQLGGPAHVRGSEASLATTALVHEAYLKLAADPDRRWRDRSHFLAVAAIAMRQILVDRARARATFKRGGAFRHVTLDEGALVGEDEPEALLALDQALDRLAALAPRLARVVELRFYGGLSEAETADVLGITTRTVQRDWAKARMLLRRALDDGPGGVLDDGPDGTPDETPDETPEGMPGRASSKAPGKAPGWPPGGAPGEASSPAPDGG